MLTTTGWLGLALVVAGVAGGYLIEAARRRSATRPSPAS
jgi:hypothetical protein